MKYFYVYGIFITDSTISFADFFFSSTPMQKKVCIFLGGPVPPLYEGFPGVRACVREYVST